MNDLYYDDPIRRHDDCWKCSNESCDAHLPAFVDKQLRCSKCRTLIDDDQLPLKFIYDFEDITPNQQAYSAHYECYYIIKTVTGYEISVHWISADYTDYEYTRMLVTFNSRNGACRVYQPDDNHETSDTNPEMPYKRTHFKNQVERHQIKKYVAHCMSTNDFNLEHLILFGNEYYYQLAQF